jgi:hypothetical protein
VQEAEARAQERTEASVEHRVRNAKLETELKAQVQLREAGAKAEARIREAEAKAEARAEGKAEARAETRIREAEIRQREAEAKAEARIREAEARIREAEAKAEARAEARIREAEAKAEARAEGKADARAETRIREAEMSSMMREMTDLRASQQQPQPQWAQSPRPRRELDMARSLDSSFTDGHPQVQPVQPSPPHSSQRGYQHNSHRLAGSSEVGLDMRLMFLKTEYRPPADASDESRQLWGKATASAWQQVRACRLGERQKHEFIGSQVAELEDLQGRLFGAGR